MSISTYGWDMVYAMRFTSVNEVLQKEFNDEVIRKQELRLRIAQILADGFNGGIKGIVDIKGQGYKKTPVIAVQCFEGNDTARFRPLLSVQEIILTSVGTGYTSAPMISFLHPSTPAPATPATATASLSVKTINVTAGGSGYFTGATVLITGGGGTDAMATATVSAGKVTAITVVNPGTGYTGVPTISFTGAGSGAAATAVLGLSIQLDSPGSGYQEVPIVQIFGGGGSGAVAEVKTRMDDIVTVDPGSGYSYAPMLEVIPDASDTDATATYASTMLKFSNPDKIPLGSDLISTFSALFKACMEISLKEVMGTDWQASYLAAAKEAIDNLKIPNDPSNPDPQPADMHSVTATDKITDYCSQLLKDLEEKIVWKNTKVRSDLEFQILLSGLDKTEEDPAYVEALYLAKSLASRYNLNPTDENIIAKVIAKIEIEEKIKIGNRAIKALQSEEALLIYDLGQLPNTPAFLKQLGQVDVNTTPKEQILQAVVDVATALLPECRSHVINAIGYKNDPLEKYKLKKIKLYTDAWQLTTGGDGHICNLTIPVKYGYLDFGNGNRIIKENNKFSILLEIELNWVRSASKAHLVLPSQKTVDVKAITIGGSPLNPPLTQDEEYLLKEYLEYTINKTSPVPPGSIIKTPLDNGYEYNATFSSLNVYEEIAVKDKALAWMFPTTYAFAVRDEAEYPPNPENSVLSICCMVQGNINKDSGSTDVNAIPVDSDTAILLSKKTVISHFIKPALTKAFYLKDPHTPEGKDKKYISTQQFQDDSEFSFSNKSDVFLVNEQFLDKTGVVQYGKIDTGKFICSLEEDHIELRFTDVLYHYDGENAQTKMQREERTSFSLTSAENGQKNVVIKTLETENTIEPIIKEGDVSFWKILAMIGIEIAIIGLGALITLCGRREGDEQRVRRGNRVEDEQEALRRMREGRELEEIGNRRDDARLGRRPILEGVEDTEELLQIIEENGPQRLNAPTRMVRHEGRSLGSCNVDGLEAENDVPLLRYRVTRREIPGIRGRRGNTYYTVPLIVDEAGNIRLERPFSCELFNIPEFADIQEELQTFIRTRLEEGIAEATRANVADNDLLVANALERDQNVPGRAPDAWWRRAFVNREFVGGLLTTMIATFVGYGFARKERTDFEDLEKTLADGENMTGNSLIATVNKIFEGVKWPNDEHLDLNVFELVGPIRIGMNFTNVFKGKVSEDNPSFVSPYINHGKIGSIVINNNIKDGNGNIYSGGTLTLQFVLSDIESSSLPKTIGNAVNVEHGVQKTVQFADFGVTPAANLILQVSSSETTHYEITLNK